MFPARNNKPTYLMESAQSESANRITDFSKNSKMYSKFSLATTEIVPENSSDFIDFAKNIKLPMTNADIEYSLTYLKDTTGKISQIVEQFLQSPDQNDTVKVAMHKILQDMLPKLISLASTTKIAEDYLANTWLLANQPRKHV